MAYSDFTYPQVLEDFQLVVENHPDLFAKVSPIEASLTLNSGLAQYTRLATMAHTEQSRAVWLVGPILADVWQRYQTHITLIAGAELRADPEAGLTGFLDFVFGKAPQSHLLNAPIMVIVEAKKDCITDAYGQCIAGMLGAQRFNQRKQKVIEAIYGCATTGSSWRFMRLIDRRLTIDATEYSHDRYEKLLGILTHIVGPVPEALAA